MLRSRGEASCSELMLRVGVDASGTGVVLEIHVEDSC